ncbi:MAG: T9SS type A sorting domain-containing protein [candidate division FCPU426 bacterium]
MSLTKKNGMARLVLLATAVLAAATARAATITVTSLENSGAGTLRQAILDANSGDIITFDTTAMGGNSITVYSGINLGKQLTLDGEDKQVVIGASGGFIIFYSDATGSGSIIRNLSLVNCGQAIYLYQADNVQILNCRLGVDWSDTDLGNSWGIMAHECDGVIIGAPGQGNVISGNSEYGIVLRNSSRAVIQGNRIGTNAAGTLAMPNQIGIRVLDGSFSTLIGGDRTAGEGNVISGNSMHGVEISNSDGYGGTGEPATGNTLAGNTIGLSLNQGARIQNNTHGVLLSYAPYNQIGLPEAGKGNVIAGNGNYNLIVQYSSFTRVQNNRVGINEYDSVSFTNNYGMAISESSGCLIGGDRQVSAYERNIISGHNISGRFGINCGAANAMGNTISGNIIGLDSTGTVARPNSIGIYLSGRQSCVGGANTGGAYGNLISGNAEVGLDIRGRENVVLGNWIGLNAAGDAALANGIGLSLTGTASVYNEIGDGTAAGRNVISGNAQEGIKCSAGFGHRILNNYIGTSADGLQQVSNQRYPVRLYGAAGCLIGQESAGNLICGRSGWQGVNMTSPECAGNTLVANSFNLLADGSLAPEAITASVIMEIGPHDNSVGLRSSGVGNLLVGADNAIALYSGTTVNNGFFGNTICGFTNTITALGISLNSGANNGKAAPVIAAALASLISGTSGANDYIQIFRSNRAEGYAGGSLALLGTTAADVSGDWSWTPSGLVYGDVVTALATDPAKNTSQFSNNVSVEGLATPTPTPTPVISPTPTATNTATPAATGTPSNPLANADLAGKAVVAFPNPAKDRMTFVFHLEAAAKVEIRLYNLAGEQVAALSGDFAAGRGQSLAWNLSGIAPGVYVARMLVNGNEKAKAKVAVVK